MTRDKRDSWCTFAVLTVVAHLLLGGIFNQYHSSTSQNTKFNKSQSTKFNKSQNTKFNKPQNTKFNKS